MVTRPTFYVDMLENRKKREDMKEGEEKEEKKGKGMKSKKAWQKLVG